MDNDVEIVQPYPQQRLRVVYRRTANHGSGEGLILTAITNRSRRPPQGQLALGGG
jgi:hypothetical protein